MDIVTPEAIVTDEVDAPNVTFPSAIKFPPINHSPPLVAKLLVHLTVPPFSTTNLEMLVNVLSPAVAISILPPSNT